MRVPIRIDYGVRALIDLAYYPGGALVNTAEMAARQNIPEPYLDQLLAALTKSGFVNSRRGPQGGHSLAMQPDKISLDMVMNTLDGSVPTLDCLDNPDECTLSPSCAQRDIWRTAEEAFQSVLSGTTIEDLVNREKDLRINPKL